MSLLFSLTCVRVKMSIDRVLAISPFNQGIPKALKVSEFEERKWIILQNHLNMDFSDQLKLLKINIILLIIGVHIKI